MPKNTLSLAPYALEEAYEVVDAIGTGVLLFSGSLVGAALAGTPTTLAPFGGTLMMLGWLLHAIGQWRR